MNAARATPQPRKWESPSPLAFPESIQSAGGLAAPLLAGFTFSIVTQLITTTSAGQSLRWPDLVLTTLLLAAFALVASVQAAIWARQYQVTPADVDTWHAGAEERAKAWAQHDHLEKNLLWCKRTRLAYNLGVLLLLASIALALTPPGPVTPGRLAAIVIAWFAAVAEMIWMTGATGDAPPRLPFPSDVDVGDRVVGTVMPGIFTVVEKDPPRITIQNAGGVRLTVYEVAIRRLADDETPAES